MPPKRFGRSTVAADRASPSAPGGAPRLSGSVRAISVALLLLVLVGTGAVIRSSAASHTARRDWLLRAASLPDAAPAPRDDDDAAGDALPVAAPRVKSFSQREREFQRRAAAAAAAKPPVTGGVRGRGSAALVPGGYVCSKREAAFQLKALDPQQSSCPGPE
jgi:hypothetical protein